MIRPAETTLGGLLALTLKPAKKAIKRWIKLRILDAQDRKLDIHEAHFDRQINNGTGGKRWVAWQRANIKHQRSLEG